jgi:hypothetical protein
MKNLPEDVESCSRLDQSLRAIVEASAARDTFRASFGGNLHETTVGWPVFRQRPALRESDILIELTTGTHTAFELALAIPAESAARWVDRALGGSGESGIASSAGTLSEAECGVLAYLAARACAAIGGVRVCDVAPVAARTLEPSVAWPLALAGPTGRCDLQCLLASWRAEANADRYRLGISVYDSAPSVSFAAGEVWISERWNLTSTSDGLAGEVQLSVDGCAAPLAAFMSSGRVHAVGPGIAAADTVELLLASQPVRFIDLATIAAGEPFAIGTSEVELRRAGTTIARGELVSWRGAVGVRIT